MPELVPVLGAAPSTTSARRAGRQRADRRRAGTAAPRSCPPPCAARRRARRVGAPSRRRSSDCPLISRCVALSRQGSARRPLAPVGDQRLDGGGQHRVAGQDRLALAEDHPAGRAVPPLEVAVHDVVVQQREVVHQLDGDRRRARRRRRVPPRRLGGQHAPASAGSPCRRRSRPGCRRCVAPAQLVGRDQPHPLVGRACRPRRAAPADRARAARRDRLRRRAGPVVTRSLSAHAATSIVGGVRPARRRRRRCRCGRRSPSCRASRWPSTPRRATGRPGPTGAAGRSAALPGAWRNVARRSRVTNASTTSARPAAGSSRASSATYRSLQRPARLVDDRVGGRDGDREILPAGRPAQPGRVGAVEEPLHRRVDRSGERQVGDLAVVDDVDVHDRCRAEAGARPRPASCGERRGGGERLAVRHGEHDGVGRPACARPSRPRACTVAPGSTDSTAVVQQHLDAGRLAARAAAAVECSSPSGTRGVADVGGRRVVEQSGAEHLGGQRQRRLVRVRG